MTEVVEAVAAAEEVMVETMVVEAAEEELVLETEAATGTVASVAANSEEEISIC